MPSSRLAFHTPLHATNTSTHVATVATRQPVVSWPATGPCAGGGRWRGRRQVRRRLHGQATVPSPAVTSPPGHDTLSIFFPMWNEELYVERAVATACRVGEAMVADGTIADYEVLVVDDASTDRTPELADALAAADRHVRVVHHERNRKLGGSIKTGFANATGDLILYSDADLPFDMDVELPRAVRLLRQYEADMVSAYRLDRTGEGYLRAVYTFFYNLMIRWMFRLKARDVNFAFKLCRRRIFDHVQLESEGSFIDAELFIRTVGHGYEVLQIGVDYFPRTRGESTLASPGIIVTILREMWSLRGQLRGLRGR